MTPVEYIAAPHAADGMTTRVIAVDGFGGAGKSTLAASLGHRVIHTDDFSSWDNPIDWWPRLLEQVLQPLSRNQRARFQRYDWDAGALAEWHVIEPGGIVVVEGVTSSRSEFVPFLAGSIWVDAPRELRLERGLERDGAEAAALWHEWMAAEDEWASRDRARERAGLIVAGH
jgi:uridine kinase